MREKIVWVVAVLLVVAGYEKVGLCGESFYRVRKNTSFVIPAEIYLKVENLKLRPSDRIYIILSRNKRDVPLGKDKFKKRIKKIEKIKEQFDFSVVFSSVDDFKKYIKLLPEKVKWAGYNTERHLTPESEMNNLIPCVNEFIKICHSYNLKATWAPSRGILKALEKRNKLKDIIKNLDGIGCQAQKILQNLDFEKFKEVAREDIKLIKKHNPEIKINIQFVYGRNSEKKVLEVIDIFKPDYVALFIPPSFIRNSNCWLPWVRNIIVEDGSPQKEEGKDNTNELKRKN